MTNEEINIAIAESVGYVRDNAAECWMLTGNAYYNDGSIHYQQLPNYVADLNAMNEVWVQNIKNNPELEDEFVKQLAYVVGYEGNWLGLSDADVATITNASARQRAEAYLKTIGKWKETTPTP